MAGDPVPPAAGALHQLDVEYFRSMKPQHVYAIRITVKKAPSLGMPEVPTPEGAMVFRPIIPGTIVTPTEQTLSMNQLSQEVLFHVTPLAFGELPTARLEFVLPGQEMRSMPLTMRGVSPRWTARLAFLVLVIPALLFLSRGARTWATPDAGLSERLNLLLPAWFPMKQTLTDVSQGFMDYLVLRGGSMQLCFLTVAGLGGLLIVSIRRNSVKSARKMSDGFGLHPTKTYGSNPKTLPGFLQTVDLKDD